MSDIEEYFTDASDNEDIESSDDEDDKIQIIKKSNENTIENILDNSDDEEEEEDEDEEVKNKGENDYYDEDDEQNGGANSEDESEDDDDDESDNEDTSAGLVTPTNKGKKTSKITVDPVLDEDEFEEDEDEEDENYLQKFDNEISKNYISEQHPECAIHNYDEIAKLTIIVKDNDGIIVDPLHRTLPFLTKYEKTRVLGQRTKQIECGATPFIKVPEGIIEAHIIAELELQQKRIPVIIRRPLPGGGSEYWNLKDLEMIVF
jgi:DNA-directed RNA polymerase subunit K/omega